MKTGMPSIRDLLIELERQASTKKDYVAAENQLKMEPRDLPIPGTNATMLQPALVMANGNGPVALPILEHAACSIPK